MKQNKRQNWKIRNGKVHGSFSNSNYDTGGYTFCKIAVSDSCGKGDEKTNKKVTCKNCLRIMRKRGIV